MNKHEALYPRILELLEEGRARSYIAEQVGLTRNQVCGLLWRLKISSENKGNSRHAPEVREQVVSLRQKGLSLSKIADETGLKSSQVAGIVARASDERPQQDPAPRVVKAQKPIVKAAVPVAALKLPKGKLGIANIGPRRCRFFCDDDYFCGVECKDNSSFCETHHAICYIPYKGAKNATGRTSYSVAQRRRQAANQTVLS